MGMLYRLVYKYHANNSNQRGMGRGSGDHTKYVSAKWLVI